MTDADKVYLIGLNWKSKDLSKPGMTDPDKVFRIGLYWKSKD